MVAASLCCFSEALVLDIAEFWSDKQMLCMTAGVNEKPELDCLAGCRGLMASLAHLVHCTADSLAVLHNSCCTMA